MRRVLFLAAVFCVAAFTAKAQDPVKVDPKHYKVEFQNAQVRVLHIRVGPHEKTPMHSHPSGVLVWLTDGHVRFTYPDGKTEEARGKAGQAAWSPAVTHAGENLEDKPITVVQIELKAKPATPKAPAAKKKS
jgi:quercetin dioxygenase-like cupin family protein